MALPSTEPEVYEIFEEGFQKFLKSTYGVLLCDGIPRLPSQVHFLTERLTHEGIKPCVVKLDVSEEEQLRRATARGGTEAEKELTASRLQKDRPMLEDVYNEIESVGGWDVIPLSANITEEAMQNCMCGAILTAMRRSSVAV